MPMTTASSDQEESMEDTRIVNDIHVRYGELCTSSEQCIAYRKMIQHGHEQ